MSCPAGLATTDLSIVTRKSLVCFMKLLLIVLVAVQMSVLAQAGADGITLGMGQTVTVNIRDLGTILAVTGVEPGVSGKDGAIEFSLSTMGQMRVLAIYNRTGRSLTYRCFLKRGSMIVETNVLPLYDMSNMKLKETPAMLETWQEPFDAVIIRDIAKLNDGKEGSEEKPVNAPETSHPPVEKLSPEAVSGMERSLSAARLLYEMDTAGWAGTDMLVPALQVNAGELPGDVRDVRYVVWRDEGRWRIIFYYENYAGDRHPIVSASLDQPLTRSSRGEQHLFDLKKKETLGENAESLANLNRKGASLFDKALGFALAPPFNSYAFKAEDGTFWFYAVAGDENFSDARIGPTYAVHFDRDLEKVLEERRSVTEKQSFPLMVRGGGTSAPGKPVLKLASPYIESEVMLFVMLHPELSPLVAVSPAGTWVLRAGVMPEFRAGEPAESVIASLSKTPSLPGGPPPPISGERSDTPGKAQMEEIRGQIRNRAAAMFFTSYMIREAKKAVAGGVDCPAFPEPHDVLIDVQGDNEFFVYFVPAGSFFPCMAVRPSGHFGPANAWKFEILKNVPAPSKIFRTNLSLVRSARTRVDEFLGPGTHIYFPVLENDEIGQVYAWSEMTRDAEIGKGQDLWLVGSCVNMVFIGTGGIFSIAGESVIDATTPGWDIRGLKKEGPFGIISAADSDIGYFSEFEILRCRLNGWLCPRLMKSGSEWVVVNRDGSYKFLEKKEAKKIKSLPAEMFPSKIFVNKNLEEYSKGSPSILNVGEKPGKK